jgi:hypothetical protein
MNSNISLKSWSATKPIRTWFSMKEEMRDEICIKYLSITAWELLFKHPTWFLSNCYGLFECKFHLIKIFDIPSWESELLWSHAVYSFLLHINCWWVCEGGRWRSCRNRSCCRITVIIVTILTLSKKFNCEEKKKKRSLKFSPSTNNKKKKLLHFVIDL